MADRVSLNINETDLREALVGLGKFTKDVKERKWRLQITDKAAESILVPAVEKAAPIYRKRPYHFQYKTRGVKLLKNRRAGPNTVPDSLKTKYWSGNLQLSMRVLKKLRKRTRTFVGPNIVNRPRAKEYGRSKSNANAFYAQMIYGSALNFGRTIMRPTLASVSGKLAQEITSEATKKLIIKAARQGFRLE